MPKHLTRLNRTLIALLLMLPLTALAQHSPPYLSEAWSMVPKADQTDAFWEGLKEHMAVRTEHEDPRTWYVYTPLLGEELNTVTVRACCFNWADMDSYRAWAEANPEVQQHWQEEVHPHVAHYGHFINQISWANSNWEKDWGPYKFFGVTRFELEPGKAAAFDAVRDELSQIAINNGWGGEEHPWMWSKAVGGTPAEMVIVPFRNFADMEQTGESFYDFIVRVLGSSEAAEKRFQSMADAIDEQSYQVWELHESMSMSSSD